MAGLYWQNMLNMIIILLPASFLCLAPLRQHMTIPFKRAMLEAGLSCLTYSLLALFISISYMNAGVLLFLAAAYFYQRARVGLSPFRVLFLFLVAANIVFYLSVMTNDLCLLFFSGNQPLDSIQLPADATSVSLQENLVLFNVFAVFTPLAYWLLRKYIAPVVTDPAITGWQMMCVLPAGYCLLIFRAALPSRPYPLERLVFIAALAALTLFTYVLLVQMLRRNADATRKAERAQNAENLLQAQGEEYERLTAWLDQARQYRHDQRHQYAVLQGLAAQGKADAAAVYLQELTGALPDMEHKPYCQNLAANAVVNHYAARAESMGARVDIRLDIPKELGRVSDSDLCVVIGNLLENAVEAAERMARSFEADEDDEALSAAAAEGILDGEAPWIRARAGLHGAGDHHFVLVVDNSFDGIVHADEATEGYFSMKRPGQRGIGLQSVLAVCEKYEGFCAFEAEGGVFRSSITLPME